MSLRGAVAATKRVKKEHVPYVRGSTFLVPKKDAIGRKLANRSVTDENKTQLSHRTFKPQAYWFEVKPQPALDRLHDQRLDQYRFEQNIIWKAFDTPELLGMLFHDRRLSCRTDMYTESTLESAEHWVREARYWRCIGIKAPFFNDTTLRANCWEDHGTQVGTIRLNAAMRCALEDLERARKRKDLGLDPDYIWDKWGPSGFIDGSRSDWLPRFAHNPHLDPDGVVVTDADILALNTHESIRERYGEFIHADPTPFRGCFSAMSHGKLTLTDLNSPEVEDLYTRLGQDGGRTLLDADMRSLMYLVAVPDLLASVGQATSWAEVQESLRAVQAENDERVDAARFIYNTRDDTSRVRSFYEEKCGFTDFMNTPDKVLTGATLACLEELKRLCLQTEYGAALALAVNDEQMKAAIGPTAFAVFRATEDLVLDRRRRRWATRFAGEANEEKALDFLLENFSRRTQPQRVGAKGNEFDREMEPIGRNVQRRVLDSDQQQPKSTRKQFGRGRSSLGRSPLDLLHVKQLSSARDRRV